MVPAVKANPVEGGAWQAAVHGVVKSRTQLSGFTFTFHFHALEKEMATHSSVLAWRIPGTGEPGGLPYGVAQSRTRLKRLSSAAAAVKNPPANAGDVRDPGLIPGSGRSPGGGYGKSPQYSCLENHMDRGTSRLKSTGSQRVGPD